MPTKTELLIEAQELGVKRYSKMNKSQLESIIYLKKIANWYDVLLNGNN